MTPQKSSGWNQSLPPSSTPNRATTATPGSGVLSAWKKSGSSHFHVSWQSYFQIHFTKAYGERQNSHHLKARSKILAFFHTKNFCNFDENVIKSLNYEPSSYGI